ncbi:MAG: Gfo/Idh/MocA family oxidoreductase, partial [bacterium]
MSIEKDTFGTRRIFLKSAAAFAVGAPYIVPSTVLGASGVAPSERITLGCIGVGGRGVSVMKDFLRERHCRVVAVCDPFTDRREAARDLVDLYYEEEGCAAYSDFHDLLARDDIDAVLIASPDHWHVLHGIAAAKAGKDLYVEKPLFLTVEEGRAIRDAVKRYGRVFQYGTQQRSMEVFRFACELVRNGRIGELHTMKVGAPASSEVEEQPEMPIPEGFDYNMWLGPAPWKPYTEKRCITPYWYFISDYSMGFVSGWGIHHIDIAQWGNNTDKTGPIEIEGAGVFPKGGLGDTATAWHVEMKYANGVKTIFTDEKKCEHGVRFEGTEGWVHANRSSVRTHPESLLGSVIGPN